MPWGEGPSVLGKVELLWKAKVECRTGVLKVQDLGRLLVDSKGWNNGSLNACSLRQAELSGTCCQMLQNASKMTFDFIKSIQYEVMN